LRLIDQNHQALEKDIILVDLTHVTKPAGDLGSHFRSDQAVERAIASSLHHRNSHLNNIWDIFCGVLDLEDMLSAKSN
jgi:hypothetical protein